MANNGKGKVQGSQNFFDSYKKQIFLFGGIVIALILTIIIILVVKNNAEDKPKEDGEFGDQPSTLESTLSFSDDLYAGYFEDDIADVTITCISGTPDCYSIDGNVVTFGAVSEDSVYAISGKLKGNIVINTGDSYKFDLEMHGFSLVSKSANPIVVNSGKEVSLTAKKDHDNYIYDMRDAIDENDETLFSGAVYATVDLEIAGKGKLTVVSENNNGIHTKDDLQVKNLTLTVACNDNALKGNDSVSLEACNTELIVTRGDGIKTTNTDVSGKGKQRGTVTITGGTHVIGAACDGIDAAYDLVIDDETTSVTIYTDKYSSASKEVTATDASTYYLRATKNNYKYSVKYYNSETDYVWVNASDSYETVTTRANRPGGGGTTYYYYTFEKKADYDKLMVYMYKSSQKQGQDEEYYASSAGKSVNDSYDTVAVSYSSSSLSISWTNYTTASSQGGWGGGPGGMQDGNSDKKDYSTKGLKAGNVITVNGGTINIKSYDDAIHAGSGTTLDNGADPLGSVIVNGGTLTLYSNDDGIHADGVLTIIGGKISIENSYEGLEGTQVLLSGGDVSILSKDDGINGTATSGTAVEISGGTLYIYCTGDGIDSNSRASYSGIVFSGGSTVVISNSSMNSAIDTESGYAYSGGTVVAIMPRGMANEATHCSDFSSVGTYEKMSLSSGQTLTAQIAGATVSVKMPCSISGYVILLGDKSASVSVD